MSVSKIQSYEIPNYIQGAADDEEYWARGLTKKLFWEHKDEILSDPDTVEDIVDEIVEEHQDFSLRTIDNEDILYTQFLPLIHRDSCYKIGDTGLYIGNDVVGTTPEVLNHFDAVINCSSHSFDGFDTSRYLHIDIPVYITSLLISGFTKQ